MTPETSPDHSDRYDDGSSRAMWILLAVCAVAWVALALASGSWVLATLLVGILGGVAAVATWSSTYYGSTRLTDTTLRAGSTRIKVADLEPAGISEPGAPVHGKLVGAGWGATSSPTAIRVVPRGKKPIWVQGRDPAALHSALVRAAARNAVDA